jgi:hypothetical protein
MLMDRQAADELLRATIAGAQDQFRLGVERLHAARPPAAGPVEMAEIAGREREQIARLQEIRDRRIQAAERAHRTAVGVGNAGSR